MATTTLTVKLELDVKGEPKTQEAMLRWIGNCLNVNANHVEVNSVTIAPTPTVVVDVEGGVVQGFHSNSPVRVIVLDADIEGSSNAQIKTINGDEFLVSDHGLAGDDAEDVRLIEDQVDALTPGESERG